MSKYQSTSKYEFRQNIQPKIAPLTAAVSGALVAGSLQAATITVDSLNDGHVAGECTLRSALYSATTNTDWGDCIAGDAGLDTIRFASGLSGTITLGTSGLYYDGSTLPVGESVTIDGDNNITIQGTGAAPVFYAKYGGGYNTDTLQLAELTITGGGGARGGGVLSRAASLQLAAATISGNVADEAGGGVWHEPYGGSGELLMLASEISGNSVVGVGGYAGGIGMRAPFGGDIQISSANFYANVALNGGGGGLHLDIPDYAQVNIKYSNFENNAAKYGNGGGIQAQLGYATVDLAGNTFINNEAYYSGGGLYLNEDNGFVQQAEITLDGNQFTSNSAGDLGGGASLTVRYGSYGTIASPVKFVDLTGDNVFDGNEAESGGGGAHLFVDDTVVATIDGAGFGNNQTATGGGGGLMATVLASEISIGNSDFVSNATGGGEGGALKVTVTDGAFYGSHVYALGNSNAGGAAGAFQVTASASDFGLEYSELLFNSATTCGGGLRLTGTPNQASVGHSVFYQNYASCGGGMSMFSPSSSNIMVEVKYSEFSHNQASATSSTTGGGAIFAQFASGSSMILKNSTVSGNLSAGYAGGVRLVGDMSADIKYSTIADNYAYNQGGGVYNTSTNCSISNSILGGNTNQTGLYQDLKGSQDCSVSNSLLAGAKYSDYSDGGGNIFNTAPKLEPLAFNGGNAGWTHALMADSPAIDAGSAGTGTPSNDQRGPGFPRVIGPAIDMGAYEFSSTPGAIFQDRFEQP